MEIFKNKKSAAKKTSIQDGINLDYDYNSEFGDGDIPDIDKPSNRIEDYEDDD